MKKSTFLFIFISVFLIAYYFLSQNKEPAPILPGEEITYERIQQLERYKKDKMQKKATSPLDIQKQTPNLSDIKEESKEDEEEFRSLKQERVNEYITTQLGITPSGLAKMRELGFEERAILVASKLSKQMNVPLDEIINKRTGKPPLGWGRIIHDFKLNHKNFNKDLRRGYSEFVNKKYAPPSED